MKNFFLFILLLPASFLNAQSWQDTSAMLDKIMSRYAEANPGCQLAISRNGRIIYSVARGKADLEHDIALNRDSKIEAGSVSKQFTAAAILLLEQRGKLSIDDDIRKYVPEVPDYGHVITIRHLLNHTSGIKDWGSIADLSGWPRGTKAYSNEDALQIISRQKTLNNKPGDEYIYTNSGYNLMAIIVQRVSGSSLAVFSKENIFTPIGMKNTEWRDNYRKVVSNRAIAYNKAGASYLTNMPNENVYGNGGLLTTAEDLLIWSDYYLTGRFGSPSLLSKQIETRPFNNGKAHVYAAGLVVDSVNGWRIITHSGATAGYRSNLDNFPQLGLSIAWLSNTSQSDLSDIPNTVRNLLVKNLVPARPATKSTSRISADSFKPYLGSYRENKIGSGLNLYWKDTAVYSLTNGGPMPVLDEKVLAAGRGRIQFFDGSRSNQALFITAGGDSIWYFKAEAPGTTEQYLQEYAGDYYSDETDSRTTLFVKDGKLFFRQKPMVENQVNAIYKDGFYFPGGDIYFQRDKKGKLSGFFVSVGRARRVEFRKM